MNPLVRIVLTSFLAALLAFAWSQAFWLSGVASPLATAGETQEAALATVLAEESFAPGAYLISDPNAPAAQPGGPLAFVIVAGRPFAGFLSTLLLGYAQTLVTALLIAVALWRWGPSERPRSFFLVYAALFSMAFFTNLDEPLWWSFKWGYFLKVFGHDAVTAALLAAPIAWFGPRGVQTEGLTARS